MPSAILDNERKWANGLSVLQLNGLYRQPFEFLFCSTFESFQPCVVPLYLDRQQTVRASGVQGGATQGASACTERRTAAAAQQDEIGHKAGPAAAQPVAAYSAAPTEPGSR